MTAERLHVVPLDRRNIVFREHSGQGGWWKVFCIQGDQPHELLDLGAGSTLADLDVAVDRHIQEYHPHVKAH